MYHFIVYLQKIQTACQCSVKEISSVLKGLNEAGHTAASSSVEAAATSPSDMSGPLTTVVSVPSSTV